ncbi:branched-chain amino acid ABC transporter permease [Noviherbaspirillum sp. CPCC 100848]|uniref:Branched-chain amino acid ABC transporter permease n=1 Tax=Noviherbaspirillum album TaxID=3080276 RepID=A0ABU6JGN1_9BURK|nr:branched-chain amino acid ABC transporter permease [Noviherbaspirillum sp. CPCC 100848]MEC4722825.1 branched-chain amino acid ABC transporter permease [Noviherbaspirillum sp. CPCC 100848]
MLTRYAPWMIALLSLITGLLLPWLKTPLVIGLSYGFAALGVSILIRAGQISFGHAGFTCLAGYAMVVINRQWPHADGLLLLAAGALAGLISGAIVGLFMMRYRAIFFGMLNLALSMVLFAALGKFYHVTGGTDGLRIERPPFLGQEFGRADYETWLLVISSVFVVMTCYLVKRYYASPSGQALVALKTNEIRLEYLGISARAVFYRAYILSAVLCGFSGAMFALIQGLVTPEMGYWVRSGEFVFIAVLGGTLHPVGAFIGAIAFEFLKLFAAAGLTGAWQMVIGTVLLILIFVAPAGLVAWLVRLDRRMAPKGN